MRQLLEQKPSVHQWSQQPTENSAKHMHIMVNLNTNYLLFIQVPLFTSCSTLHPVLIGAVNVAGFLLRNVMRPSRGKLWETTSAVFFFRASQSTYWFQCHTSCIIHKLVNTRCCKNCLRDVKPGFSVSGRWLSFELVKALLCWITCSRRGYVQRFWLACHLTNSFPDDIRLWDMDSEWMKYIIQKLSEPYIKVQYLQYHRSTGVITAAHTGYESWVI